MPFSITNPRKKTTCGIYAIVNRLNGKRYIGSSVNIQGRWRSHKYELCHNKHHSAHLQSAWNKYGADCFDFVVLEVCSVDFLLSREQHYLDEYLPEYNTIRLAGNNLGYRFSDEVKAKMRVVHSVFRHTEESKKKMSAIWSNKPRGKYSEERRAKMSAAHKGKKPDDNQRRGLEVGQRMAKSDETRKKISDAQKGYQPTEETREKLRQAWARRKARKANGL